MLQIIQNLKSGETVLEKVPAPLPKTGSVLIKTRYSLVSLGTEKMLVEFGKANLINKARQQPEKVQMVLDKIKSDGLLPTLDSIFKKLDEPLPLGYCNAGEVIAVGDDVTEFKVGDRVASNGPHAEIVLVPKNLVAKIPDNVSFEEACFTVISAIGLQGMRLVKPTFGESIVVIGLGLIGLITSQLLKANGCRVIGYDFDETKVKLAKSFGVDAYKSSPDTDTVRQTISLTAGIGADAVVITASTTSNQVISQSAQMCRKKGRIVLVGVIGLDIKRSDFYEKELSFQVSCSYGPGRYDDSYEQRGVDYPLPFVRWTEKRNFEAVLQALSNGQLSVRPLISEVVNLEKYNSIYGNIGSQHSIASLIRYPAGDEVADKKVEVSPKSFAASDVVLGIIGAGNFTKMTVLPTLTKLKWNIKYICSEKGLSSTMLAKKYGIQYSTTDYREILKDPEVTVVAITVRHNQHARLVIQALESGKHVFVEKPMALTAEELNQVGEAYKRCGKTVTVGFNRRFSPFSERAKNLLNDAAPINVIATMNAGFVPPESWVHDLQLGGGRIVGEACHLIDLISYFTGSLVKEVAMTAAGENPKLNTDNASILLKYRNGSIGSINYFSNGSKAYSKERFEIYSHGRTMIIDNFKKLECFGFAKGISRSQDKGHYNQFSLLRKKLSEGGSELIPFEELMNTSRAALGAIQSLQTGTWIKLE